jgi:hypothetical protein
MFRGLSDTHQLISAVNMWLEEHSNGESIAPKSMLDWLNIREKTQFKRPAVYLKVQWEFLRRLVKKLENNEPVDKEMKQLNKAIDNRAVELLLQTSLQELHEQNKQNNSKPSGDQSVKNPFQASAPSMHNLINSNSDRLDSVDSNLAAQLQLIKEKFAKKGATEAEVIESKESFDSSEISCSKNNKKRTKKSGQNNARKKSNRAEVNPSPVAQQAPMNNAAAAAAAYAHSMAFYHMQFQQQFFAQQQFLIQHNSSHQQNHEQQHQLVYLPPGFAIPHSSLNPNSNPAGITANPTNQ